MNTATVKFTSVDVKQRQNLGVRAGDTVKVWQKIQEKGKTRLQVFEGLVLSVKHGKEPGATFTVRRTSSGVGIEKIFPLYSPMIDKVEIVKRSKVRQSKLYHIRDKAAKEIRRQMRNTQTIPVNDIGDAFVTESDEEEIGTEIKSIEENSDEVIEGEKNEDTVMAVEDTEKKEEKTKA
ncbi:MAG: 50S ribosomal protein L19 [Candidatus Zambryskibacteria bacterium CG_4_9_14_3_um_filter_40_16]|uniref:50S ribosomal protein L19 n=1 Tax=Candidatus Zambryskibacteria bacterium CG_4_9_14_3_um_filter_40_16 TaxID=1975111 RepID=A0A2M7WUP1_9BACT|nr:MAG: 50S ribosomal protein L19 [Candidatus Zambryskibacteria bacterium CG_4_9_14_3_um_filter_40_16]